MFFYNIIKIKYHVILRKSIFPEIRKSEDIPMLKIELSYSKKKEV